MENWADKKVDDAQHPPRDGRRSIVLRPAPILKTITLDVAEEGLRMMGVEIDDLMRSGEGDPPKPTVPKLADGKAFLDVVLKNAGEIDLGSMPLDRAQAALGVIAGNFFAGCLMVSIGQPWEDEG